MRGNAPDPGILGMHAGHSLNHSDCHHNCQLAARLKVGKEKRSLLPDVNELVHSPNIKKAVEEFQTKLQIEEIRNIIAILEDRIGPLQNHGQGAATNFRRLAGNIPLQKRLAKFMTRFCSRDNTPLESFHADPDSRIDQNEMKALMIAAVQNCYTLVGLLCGENDNRPDLAAWKQFIEMVSGSTDLLAALERHDFNPEWNEPQDSQRGCSGGNRPGSRPPRTPRKRYAQRRSVLKGYDESEKRTGQCN